MDKPKRNRPGQPHALTEDKAKLILQAIRAGNYARDAALCAGITEVTFYNWKKYADDGIEPFKEFFKSLKEQEAAAKADVLRNLMSDDKGWQRYAWYLERRDREVWGRYDKVEHTGAVEVKHTDDLSKLTADELAAVKAIRLKLGDGE